MKLSIARLFVLVGLLVAAAGAFAEPPAGVPNEITEISFRQSCLCGADGFINIALKSNEPSTAKYFPDVSRWLQTQKFFELQDNYSSSPGAAECQRTYTVVRGGLQKRIVSDCVTEPAELWALRTVLLRVADDITKDQIRQLTEKQGVRGAVQHYLPPAPAPGSMSVGPLIIYFLPEPYQDGLRAGRTMVQPEGTFLVSLLPGSYRVVLQFPDSSTLPRQLIKILPERFSELNIDGRRSAKSRK